MFLTVRGGSWFWSCRHSRAPHLARALSSGLRSEAPRSPVSAPVERLVGSGRKSLQGAGQRREKHAQESLAGRRAPRRNQWAPNNVGRAMIIMMHCVLLLPHDFQRAHFGEKEMLSVVALLVMLVATAASPLSAASHEWYVGLRSPSSMWSCPRQTGQAAGWCALMNWRGERIPRARCGCISL